MTTTQQSDESAELFSKLFRGYENAYGEYEIDHTEDSGKQVGKAVTLMRAASLSNYKHHLSGAKGIGIIPLLMNDTCWFGAIDIDIKGDTKLSESHESLEAKVRRYKLPLMLFRSKSNGAHLYLFAKEPISARLMQSRLTEFSSLLGYGGCEVFPKQVTRLKRDGTDFGNWINIPLFGKTRTGLFEGKELTKEESLKTCVYLSVTEKELRGFVASQSDEFSDGPPCLQQMATVGIGEGGRNSALFNVGIYLRKKYPEEWQEKLEQYNEERVDPPLSSGEMRELKKQISRKDYFYTCKVAPICNFCDKKKCIKRKFGIGYEDSESHEGSFVLPITGLTKYIAGDRGSYRWGVSTTEAMLEFTTEELLSIDAHRKKFAELMNIIIPAMKAKEFNDQLQRWMNKCEVIYDPEDASEEGELISNIESWFFDKSGARDCDDMLKRLWWTNPENDVTYFMLAHLLDFLVHQKKMRMINRHKLSRLLQEKFRAEQCRLLIRGKRRNCYSIANLDKEDESPLDLPEVERKEEML